MGEGAYNWAPMGPAAAPNKSVQWPEGARVPGRMAGWLAWLADWAAGLTYGVGWTQLLLVVTTACWLDQRGGCPLELKALSAGGGVI